MSFVYCIQAFFVRVDCYIVYIISQKFPRILSSVSSVVARLKLWVESIQLLRSEDPDSVELEVALGSYEDSSVVAPLVSEEPALDPSREDGSRRLSPSRVSSSDKPHRKNTNVSAIAEKPMVSCFREILNPGLELVSVGQVSSSNGIPSAIELMRSWGV